VFSYSERGNTPAAEMKNKVEEIIKKERTRKLRKISNLATENFYIDQIGKERDVIFEKEIEENLYNGHTDNYIQVVAESTTNIIKLKMNVRLIKFINDKIEGKIFSS
jgi:threonylcarbamoyladenosine tRNA methylthiotransferase MtaB